MRDSADKHRNCQEPSVLINLSQPVRIRSNIPDMGKPFQDALRWHMDKHGVSIPEIADATGVSPDVIKKLRREPPYSTSVENGIALAGYFGRSVEQFIRREEPETEADEVLDLFSLLREDEARILLAQVRGILGNRVVKAG